MRCAGCNLGKPVEGWERHDRIRQYLEQAGADPMADYFPVLDPMPDGFVFNESWRESTRGNIISMAGRVTVSDCARRASGGCR